MDRARLTVGIASVFALLGAPAIVGADPVRIAEGYIQITSLGPDFAFTTETGVAYAGERESSAATVPMLQGFSGDVLNLSSSYSGPLTSFSEYAPERVDLLGLTRADFDFRAGDVMVPPLDDVMATSNGVEVFAPFSFSGSILIFATAADAMANTNPIDRRDFFGSGTARATFNTQFTNEGERRPDLPLVSYGMQYWFGPNGDPAPVPEPGTLALIAGGLAAAGVRARRRRA